MTGRLVLFGSADPAFERCELGAFDAFAVTVCGPDKEANEDGALVRDLGDGTLALAVADGMGGMNNGALAARLTIESIDAALERRTPDASRRAALVEGLEAAHGLVQAQCLGGGATVVAAVFGTDTVQIVHSGDAEAMVVGGGGKLRYRTVPHSPVGYAQAAGFLSEVEALAHPERHVVSTGVGIEGMEIQVGPRIATRPRDTLLLASDGLFDNLLQEELVALVRRGSTEGAARELVGLARSRMESNQGATVFPGKPDDLTLIVARRR